MITTTYQDVMGRAAENAGRTRDKVPPSEQVMLLGWIDSYLHNIWQDAVWPELIVVAAAPVAVANHSFSKNEGSVDPTAPEMGDILGYYTRAPRNPEDAPEFDFNEGNGVVNIGSHHSSVWPVYLLPCPDLTAVAAAALPAYTLPMRFKAYLAYMAGGELAKADGDANLAGTNFGLGEKQLAREQSRAWDALPSWLKRFRLPRRHEHRRMHAAPGAVTPGENVGAVGVG